MSDNEGVFPETLEGLTSLPGGGPNTAGAILAYSFNQSVVFIETNVRTVYFQHFFHDQPTITDKELKEVVAATVDTEHPREWYWSLMDYGSFLKRQGVGRNNKSHHYKKQSALRGSVREVRGQIIKELSGGDKDLVALKAAIAADERFPVALEGLIRDGLVDETNEKLHLAR